MKYTITVAPAAEKAFCKLPRADQRHIAKKIDLLSSCAQPVGAEKLCGKQSIYRIRSGDYRIIYEIQEKVLLILVVRIGHRKEVYRDL